MVRCNGASASFLRYALDFKDELPESCRYPGEFKYGLPEVEEESLRALRSRAMLSTDGRDACNALSALVRIDGATPVKDIPFHEILAPSKHYIGIYVIIYGKR